MTFLLNTVGAILLLLWGIRMVRTGITRAYGDGLQHAIKRSVHNRLKAASLGMVATMLLQSSLATSVIVISFASRGMIETASGLAVMLGADIGAALLAQVLSFDTQWLAPAATSVGFILNKVGKSLRIQQLGRAILGLGIMFLALKLIVAATLPLREAEMVKTILQALGDEFFLAIIFAMFLSWLAHSTLAIILLIVSLAASSVLPPEVAFVLVIGANLGGTIAPIIASFGDGSVGRRIPVGNAVFKFSVAFALYPFLPMLTDLLASYDIQASRMVVNVHVLFNLIIAAIYLPLIVPAGDWLERVFPRETVIAGEDSISRRLDAVSLKSPPIALANATRTTDQIGEIVEFMLKNSMKVLQTGDADKIEEIIRRDDEVDHLQNTLKMYAIQISRGELEESESCTVAQIIGFSTDLEQIGDICEFLANLARKKKAAGAEFSKPGLVELQGIHSGVMEVLRLSIELFLRQNASLAQKVLRRCEDLEKLEIASSANHIARLTAGNIQTNTSSAYHLDAIRHLSWIRSHLSANASQFLAE